MSEKPSPEISRLLVAWSEGDEAALAALMPLVQYEPHRIAKRHLAQGRHGH